MIAQRNACKWLGCVFAQGTLLLACLQSSTLQAQSPEAEAVLTWMTDYAGLPVDSAQSSLGTFKPPYVTNFEVRTETDRFDAGRQRFQARARPILPHVRRAEANLQQTLRYQLGEIGEDDLLDAYGDALGLLAEAATDAREAAFLDTLINLEKRLVEVAKLRLAEPGFDVEDVLDAEDNVSAIRLRQEELAAQLGRIAFPVDVGQVASLSDVRQRLERLETFSPSAESVTAELAVIDAEMQLERAENTQWLDFLNVEFRGQDAVFEEQFRLGLSISIPQRTNRIRALDELEIERLEELRKAELDAATRIREFREDLMALRLALARYDALRSENSAREIQRERLVQVYLRTEATRPDGILKLRRRSLRDRLALLRIEEEVREGYLDLVARYIVLDVAAIDAWVLK